MNASGKGMGPGVVVVGLVASLGAGALPAEGLENTVTLAYRASAPQVLRLREVRTHSIASADGHREDHSMRSLREVESSVEAREGRLFSVARNRRERVEVDGRMLDASPTGLDEVGETSELACFTPRGGNCQDLPVPPALLPLPEGPVAVGASWSQVLPAGLDNPVDLGIEHRLVALEACGPRRCARISSSGVAEREAADGALEIHFSALVLFDLDRGVLVRSRSELGVKAVYVRPGTDVPPVRVDRRTRRDLARIEAERPIETAASAGAE